MSIQSRYHSRAALDVEDEKAALFTEVYDKEDEPLILSVPGVVAAARVERQPVTMILGGELGEALAMALGPAVLIDHVLALGVTPLSETIHERRHDVRRRRRRRGHQEPDAARFGGRLGVDRPGHEHRGDGQVQDDRAATRHWIVSSARSSSDGGIVRRGALAVLMLPDR